MATTYPYLCLSAGTGQVTERRWLAITRGLSGFYWEGKAETGETIASGTYFYQLQAGDYTETRKMVILK